MSQDDAEKACPDPRYPNSQARLAQHDIHAEFLLTAGAVDKLTKKLVECFNDSLSEDDKGTVESIEVDQYAWLRGKMFEAWTTSLCGSQLLNMYPDLADDFWLWDENLVAMLFGIPRLFARRAYAARDRLLDRLERWLIAGYECPSSMDDGIDWEPSFGSRVVRKRHEFYNQQSMSIRGQAGNDLIFLAGSLSNATPATGWLLLHVVSPTSPAWLLPRILDELKTAQLPDQGIHIPTLVRLPLLNSTFNEVLRMYVDFIMVRQVESGGSLDQIPIAPGEQVMGSTWMTHRNEDYFPHPERFVPDRFIFNVEGGKVVHSVDGLAGKYFPFGGGHYQCPGRAFARQEVLSAVAVILLTFDIVPLRFIVAKGKGAGDDLSCSGFPTIKNALPGNVVVGIDGDLHVRMTRKLTKG